VPREVITVHREVVAVSSRPNRARRKRERSSRSRSVEPRSSSTGAASPCPPWGDGSVVSAGLERAAFERNRRSKSSFRRCEDSSRSSHDLSRHWDDLLRRSHDSNRQSRSRKLLRSEDSMREQKRESGCECPLPRLRHCRWRRRRPREESLRCRERKRKSAGCRRTLYEHQARSPVPAIGYGSGTRSSTSRRAYSNEAKWDHPRRYRLASFATPLSTDQYTEARSVATSVGWFWFSANTVRAPPSFSKRTTSPRSGTVK
jgi:hypothetical protein